MSQLHISKMVIEGFTSFMYQEFDWNKPGLNVIQAPNGSGKSKLINALVWCLYGKTLSGSVTPWISLQDESYKGTMVGVEFLVGKHKYSIARCKDYKKKIGGAKGGNRLIVMEGGEEISDKGKTDKQRYIDDLLGYSFELFKNSIIFGQKLKKLINETGPNKKKVLDEAFEIAYISKARKIAEEKLTKVKLDIYQLEPRVEILIDRIESDERLLVTLEKEEKERQKNNKAIKESLKTEIVELEIRIEEITELLYSKESLEKRLDKLINKIDIKSTAISSITKDIRSDEISLRSDEKLYTESLQNYRDKAKELAKALKEIPEKCPRCNKPFDENDLDIETRLIERDIKDNLESIKSVKESLKDIRIGISNLVTKQASLNEKQLVLETLKAEKNALETSLNNLEKVKEDLPKIKKNLYDKRDQLESLNNSSAKNNIQDLQTSLADLKRELEEKKYPLTKLRSERKLLQWMISDPLSNSGIKVFVFDTMMDKINQRLQYYADYIGFDIRFSVNMEGKLKEIDTFILKGEEILPYEDLSGGQQQAVDIATIFAVHDVVTENKSCNLLIMDEIFEGLDASNIELVTELIQDKAKDKSLYLVTHREEFIPTHSNIIKILYSKGLSSVA